MAVASQAANGSTSTINGGAVNQGAANKVKKSIPTAPAQTVTSQKKTKPQTPSQAAFASITPESQ